MTLAFDASGDGAVRVQGVAFRPPDGYQPVGCLDDGSGWLALSYGNYDSGQEHTFVASASMRKLEPEIGSQITPATREDELWAFAQSCVETNRANPRCVDLRASESETEIPGLDCVSWAESWDDVKVPGAEGERWPMRVRSIACLDPADPPTTIAMLSWSERRAPSEPGLNEVELEELTREFLTSLSFDGE